MQGNIKFSILVPVYNAVEYLDDCIQSVLKQTYQNYELILVNDGSKDNSGEFCDRYAQMYSNIFAYHKENAGQLHTREYAIAKANGDYYVFLDSDDTLRENALEIIQKKVKEYDCDCLMYQIERVWEGEVLHPAPKFADSCITDKRELYKKCLLSPNYNSMCCKAIKAEVFQRGIEYTKEYTSPFGEDLVQSLDVLKNSDKVVFTDAVLYNYTFNPNSITRTVTCENLDLFKFATGQRVLTFLKDEAVWGEEEFRQYRNDGNYLLCRRLLAIGKQKMSCKKKREMFAYIRNTEFYRGFLKQANYKGRELRKRTYMFNLFQKEYDTILIAYLWCYWRTQDLKKWLKK